MKKDLTELVFILDKSGSMAGLESDTIGGFNAMIEKHQKIEGEAIVSTVLFNDESTVICDRVDVKKVKKITKKDYFVEGCTALLDAIGKAIHHINNVHKYIREEDVPEHTMFIITTDGMENASREYDYRKIKEMIKYQKNNKNWEFIFLGANIDVENVSYKMGIEKNRSIRYLNDQKGQKLNYDVVTETITQMRTKGSIDDDWAEPIKNDYKTRNK